MENRYSRGKIYKIVCNKTGRQYVGSTTEPTLARRLAKHRTNFKRWKNGVSSFVASYIILEEEDYQIVLLEICPCSSKDELLMRERFWQDKIECIKLKHIVAKKNLKKIVKSIIKNTKNNGKRILKQKGKKYHNKGEHII